MTVWIDFEHPDKAEAAKIARWMRKRPGVAGAQSHHFRVSVFFDDDRANRLDAASETATIMDDLVREYGDWRPRWTTVHA